MTTLHTSSVIPSTPQATSQTTPQTTPQTNARSGSTSGASDPLPYHRLARSDWRHRWWRPLLVGLVALGLYVAATLAIVVLVSGVGIAFPAAQAAVDASWEPATDMGEPVTFGLLLGSVALLLPATVVADRLVGARPSGLLSSVGGRLRWRWLATTTVLALVIWVPLMVVALGIDAAHGSLVVRHVAPGTMLVLLLLTVALVPFQAAAEEYVFRGYLAQLVGSWLRHPVFAVLLPVPLFVAGHGYGTFGAIDVALFAVVAGYLAWRTGGLEASIAAHVVNNAVLMSAAAIGLGDPNATDTDVAGLMVSVTTMLVFAVVVTWRAKALGIERVREAPAVEPTSPTALPNAIAAPRA